MPKVVKFVAEQDCTLTFNDGSKLTLRKGVAKSKSFSKDGTYSYQLNCRGACTPTSPIIVP